MAAILTYHHIDNPPADEKEANLYVSPRAFEAQMEYLREAKFNVISLDRLREGLLGRNPLPQRAVVITFDDGYENNFVNAYPILQRYGYPATFFITTGRIGWVGPTDNRHMHADQLRELDAAGMTIGSHTVSHEWLAKIPPEDANYELQDSKVVLEALLAKPVRWVCYPSGSFNRDIVQMAQKLGYVGGCSVIRDNQVKASQLFYLPRVMVMRDTSPMRFRYYFSGLYHFLHARKNRKRWSEYL